jgi:predicted acyl esterase
MSDQTSSDFAEVIEWAAEQDWSNGKVGLLGISYFGGSQWRVAARKPKGLAAIIPWEVSGAACKLTWVASNL